MTAVESFAQLALAQFISVYSEVYNGSAIEPDELKAQMWARLCMGNARPEKLPFKVPYDNIKKCKVQLPYMPDDIKYTGCCALKKNGGLYTPCCGKIKDDELVCGTCDKTGCKFGTMENRQEKIDDEEISPITYGEWLHTQKMSLPDVYEKLHENGISISIGAEHLLVRSAPKRRKGRPAKSDDSVVDEDSEEKPEKPKKIKKTKGSESESDKPKVKKEKKKSSESESETEKPKKVKKTSESESETEKPKEKPKKVKKTSESESETEKPKKVKKTKASESESEEKPKKEKKEKKEKKAKEPEPEPEVEVEVEKPKKEKKEKKAKEPEPDEKPKKEKKEKKEKKVKEPEPKPEPEPELEEGEINEELGFEDEEGEIDGQPVYIRNGVIFSADKSDLIGKMVDGELEMMKKWNGEKWGELDDDESVDGKF